MKALRIIYIIFILGISLNSWADAPLGGHEGVHEQPSTKVTEYNPAVEKKAASEASDALFDQQTAWDYLGKSRRQLQTNALRRGDAIEARIEVEANLKKLTEETKRIFVHLRSLRNLMDGRLAGLNASPEVTSTRQALKRESELCALIERQIEQLDKRQEPEARKRDLARLNQLLRELSQTFVSNSQARSAYFDSLFLAYRQLLQTAFNLQAMKYGGVIRPDELDGAQVRAGRVEGWVPLLHKLNQDLPVHLSEKSRALSGAPELLAYSIEPTDFQKEVKAKIAEFSSLSSDEQGQAVAMLYDRHFRKLSLQDRIAKYRELIPLSEPVVAKALAARIPGLKTELATQGPPPVPADPRLQADIAVAQADYNRKTLDAGLADGKEADLENKLGLLQIQDDGYSPDDTGEMERLHIPNPLVRMRNAPAEKALSNDIKAAKKLAEEKLMAASAAREKLQKLSKGRLPVNSD